MRNRITLLLGLTAILAVLIIQSCGKDEFSSIESNERFSKIGKELYDEVGPKIGKIVDLALNEKPFKESLLALTKEMPMGDYEVLFSSLLKHKTKDGIQIKEIFLSNARGILTENEINTFLQTYPSFIIATRGSTYSWEEGNHVPPTVFVPSRFDEDSKEIVGIKYGNRVVVDLNTKYFQDAVIALHISERHDSQGNPINTDYDLGGNTLPLVDPQLDFTSSKKTKSTQVEPTFCPIGVPEVSNFDAVVSNGGIKLEFEIDNVDPQYLGWTKVEIIRHDPFGGNNVKYLYTNGLTSFVYDTNPVIPLTEYSYSIRAWVRFISPKNSAGWVNCTKSTVQHASVIAPESPAPLSSFIGTNISNKVISYEWQPPTDVPSQQYRIRRFDDNGNYNLVHVHSGESSSLQFPYTYKEEDRGKMINMEIQYKNANNIWTGDFSSGVYGSYRNNYEPFKFYGINTYSQYDENIVGEVPDQNPNVTYHLDENGNLVEDVTYESPIYGFPELRILVVRAAGTVDDRTTVVESEIVVPMWNCETNPQYINGILHVGLTPRYTPWPHQAVNLMNSSLSWDNKLSGNALTIRVQETDEGEIRIDDVGTGSTTTETKKLDIKATYGFNIGTNNTVLNSTNNNTNSDNSNINLGYSNSFDERDTESYSYEFPASDEFIRQDIVYYHSPREIVLNGGMSVVYGNTERKNGHNEAAPCQILSEIFN